MSRIVRRCQAATLSSKSFWRQTAKKNMPPGKVCVSSSPPHYRPSLARMAREMGWHGLLRGVQGSPAAPWRERKVSGIVRRLGSRQAGECAQHSHSPVRKCSGPGETGRCAKKLPNRCPLQQCRAPYRVGNCSACSLLRVGPGSCRRPQRPKPCTKRRAAPLG